ncbi:MAG TPA: RagB/SusD family nutrient uptake outer membrane protein [Gemmatimonadaceae bacterium]|nr:RagB/SusD family nutrient uptake outer membrane protein [Gemmatimonadaceae bacterium]
MKNSLMRALVAASVLAVVPMAACDLGKTLSVQPANLIAANSLEQPENAQLLVAGAASDFDCAFNSYVVVSALIGEEFEDALQTADRWPYDQRTVSANQARYSQNGCTALGVYQPLQAARVSATNVRGLLEGWTDVQVPGRNVAIARMSAYQGWSELLIGEAFCSTVFSTVHGETVNFGTEITRAQALDTAIAAFTNAISVAQAAGGVTADSIRFFALVGRARAKQDKGDLSGARADAVLVPATFVWNVTASNSNTRRQNRVFQENNPGIVPSSSVGARYRQASYTSDPRIKVQNTGKFSNGTNVPLWTQSKYTAVTSPIPVATGTEMQLLIAEADIATNRANTLAIIAQMRAAGNQPAYTGTTAADDLAEIIDQRRRALFLTGTHLGDLIRYNITLSPAAGASTPWGQQYGPDKGNQLCMPLPQVEILNNPLLHS